MNQQLSPNLKLFMLLLGSKAPNRNVEQHDYFFGIAGSLKELIPEIRAFWPEAGTSLHIDGWREINTVDGYNVKVIHKDHKADENGPKLFFINLGGYQRDKLEEQHYIVLTVRPDRTAAVQEAKKTVFFKNSTIKAFKGANSHIDEKYGVDVDDVYRIDDILAKHQKALYHIQITPGADLTDDEIHLGYFKLDKI